MTIDNSENVNPKLANKVQVLTDNVNQTAPLNCAEHKP